MALFPRSQFLILRSEDMFDDPAHCWNQIQSFIEVPPIHLPDVPIRANAGKNENSSIRSDFRLMLRDQLQETYTAMNREYGISWSK